MVQNFEMLTQVILGWAGQSPLAFFLSVSAFSLRSAPVQHFEGWQEEEQQGETDTVLVSFTLLLLLILRERILTFYWIRSISKWILKMRWHYYSCRIDSLFVCVLLTPVCSGSLCWSWEFCWSRWPAWAGTLFGTQ